MQFPKRIKVIGDLIAEGSYIADIGADHGLLEQYIALHLDDYHVFAVENKEGPAGILKAQAGCLRNVIISHSDGLNKVSDEYDTLVLAGMGGDNIIEILTRDPKKLKAVKQIIIDAHSFIPKVRRKLIELGFAIDYEELVYEKGIYYIIISFKRNTNNKVYTEDELDFGYKLFLDPIYEDYKKVTLSKLEKVKKSLANIDSSKEKYDATCEEIRRLENYGKN